MTDESANVFGTRTRLAIASLALSFAKVSGVLLGAATLIYLSRRVHPLVSLCTAASGVFVYWCVTGLETPLFAYALIVALGELYVGNLSVAAACFGVLPWIRPDGVYFTALVFVPMLALNWHRPAADREISWKMAATLGALVVVPYVALLLWRLSYYGDLQPNTYKAGEFEAALRDFKAAIALGGNQPYQFSNVGWALKALGRGDEAQPWFERGPTP